MKIIFINPWSKSLFGDEKQATGHPHIGLAYLIAVCKKNGYNKIRVFDQGIEKNDEVLFKEINSFKPDLIALTTFSYCYKYAKELVDNIKSHHPYLPLIAGGAHISATKGHILEDSQADFAMKGECENSFIAFLKEMESFKPDYSRIDNLLWRQDGRVIENRNAPFIEDLDSIAFPDYQEFGLERYLCYKHNLLPLITSRGCPYRCNYCSIQLSMGRSFRARSPRNVISEIKYLKDKYHANHFEINDDCFALDMQRAEAICDGISRENLDIKYEIYNGIRADNVNERLLKKMKESGCIFISYGCESGNQEIVNKYIGKNLKLEKVVEAVDLTNKVGIRNSVNFIIGHPGETYKLAMQTLKFAESLKTDFVNVYNLVPYPGTGLFEWIKSHATFIMQPQDYLEKVGSRDASPVFETKEFSRGERIKVLKKGFNLYEKTILRFRFGKIRGLAIYYLLRNRKIFSLVRYFVFNTTIGTFVYRALSRKSRDYK